MNLDSWQTQLESHFQVLSRIRRTGHWPVFALEHGLAERDLADLEEGIRRQIAVAPPRDIHWLVWVIYAVEKGYRYSGDEYWQTFEASTPRWALNGDRGWIRRQFERFRDVFSGANPEGIWAKHFTIICWPITHARLPCDLQRHLAQVLYEVRHAFSAELLEAPRRLGELIAARSWNATSRFQNLAQEPLFLGQIAAALLLQGKQGSDNLILDVTLKRIATDLDRERRAREWLRAAQGSAQRFSIRGLSSLPLPGKKGHGAPPSGNVVGARALARDLAIEPRLVLQPRDEHKWLVQLEFPDLSCLLAKFPGLRHVLGESRAVVAGSSGTPRARGYFLTGPQRVLLREWPKPEDVLLRFDDSTPELEMLLRTECLLRPGPIWLFKIASDGVAYEQRSLRVRAPGDYIVVRTDGPIEVVGPWSTATEVECAGISGVRLSVPDDPSAELIETLEESGLTLAGVLEAWPAGVPVAMWDGEGRAIWLSTDRPRVALRTNYPDTKIFVTLAGNPEVVEIPPHLASKGAFVELPALPVGSHLLQARAVGDDIDVAGTLEIVIREPRAWRPGLNSQSAMFVSIDPPLPTLEEIWEDRVRIEAHGPLGRQVSCRVELHPIADGAAVKGSFPLAFPARKEDWSSGFEGQIRQRRDFQNAYDLARSGRICFDGGDLGVFALPLERHFVPLRWRVERHREEQRLALLDDTGGSDSTTVQHYSFKTPDAATPVDRQDWTRGFQVPPEGGLYLALSGHHTAGVIAPPVLAGLADLKVRPQVRDRPRTAPQINEVLILIDRWARARMTGGFSLHRRREVLEALLRHVFGLIAGRSWERSEVELRDRLGAARLEVLARAISGRPDERPLAVTLNKQYRELAGVPVPIRVTRFADVIREVLHLRSAPPKVTRHDKFNLVAWERISDTPRWLPEFALRLASWPPAVVAWSGEDLIGGLERLMEVPSLARASRFLVLAVSEVFGPASLDIDALYPGWDWQ